MSPRSAAEAGARIVERRAGCEPLLLDWATRTVALSGRDRCDDVALVAVAGRRALLAVLDEPASDLGGAERGDLALELLQEYADQPLERLIVRCRERLGPPDAALALAAVDAVAETLGWIAIGEVSALIARGGDLVRAVRRRPVAGGRRPRPAIVPIETGDLVVLATDGLRPDFERRLELAHRPSRIAEQLLAEARRDGDAAIAVGRYLGLGEELAGLVPPTGIGDALGTGESRAMENG